MAGFIFFISLSNVASLRESMILVTTVLLLLEEEEEVVVVRPLLLFISTFGLILPVTSGETWQKQMCNHVITKQFK